MSRSTDRRALSAALETVFAERRRAFIGVFDLDGFKAYNDTFGHPAGDALLTRAATQLRSRCGPGDAAFRMGGDEFLMIAERDGPLGGRSDQVSVLARGTALALGIAGEALHAIDLASRLHDIGKMAISETILGKPGPLDPGEFPIGISSPARRRWRRRPPERHLVGEVFSGCDSDLRSQSS